MAKAKSVHSTPPTNTSVTQGYIDWRHAWVETLIQAVLHLDDVAVLS
jgi:hypothetical protein